MGKGEMGLDPVTVAILKTQKVLLLLNKWLD
jgi:hypothetical protein